MKMLDHPHIIKLYQVRVSPLFYHFITMFKACLSSTIKLTILERSRDADVFSGRRRDCCFEPLIFFGYHSAFYFSDSLIAYC